eukprot:TRINITY_DN8574_c0_g1_i2.p1 TRINITY_DN8574_c0_g1~~TRINITY_DN8574_c0_g1_i2.p1  ORF type:complete len:261 (+),score=52.02 TRINITY_DN8574_c0_g1_i2:50-832(+)
MQAGVARHETELTGICFKDPMWLAQVGLNAHTVLDYFALSQFYDNTCNNELLKMQIKVTGLPFDFNRLAEMVGLEYVVCHVQEPVLYVIRKQWRESPTLVTARASYYVLEGSIYQAPSLHAVLSARLVQSAYNIALSFKEVASHAQFSVVDGYTWNWPSSDKAPGSTNEGVKPSTQTAKTLRDQRNDAQKMERTLTTVIAKFPPPPPPQTAPILEGDMSSTTTAIKASEQQQPPPPPPSATQQHAPHTEKHPTKKVKLGT